MVIRMSMTYAQLEHLTKAYNVERLALAALIVPIPASLNIYNPTTQESTTLLAMLREMDDGTMPENIKESHKVAQAALLTFHNKMNAAIHEAKINNYNVSLKMRDLHTAYVKETNIPERKIKAALIINKKNIDEEDHAAMVDVYKALKITHYLIHTVRDIVYYDSDVFDFHTMKNMLVMHSPSAFQFKYPDFWDEIKNRVIINDPLSLLSEFPSLIRARKA
jgi:hypothetical protein